MASYQFTVSVEVERQEGKFAGRDEIEEALTQAISDAIDNADLWSLGADGTSVYEVIDSSIEAVDMRRARKIKKETQG